MRAAIFFAPFLGGCLAAAPLPSAALRDTHAPVLLAAGGASYCAVYDNDAIGCLGLPGRPPHGDFYAIDGMIGYCGIDGQGRAECWGGAPEAPEIEGQYGVSCGTTACCGWMNDGPTTCWGEGPVRADGADFQQVAVGGDAACGIRVDQRVVCWGDGPTAGGAAGFYVDIALTEHVGCAIQDADGDIRCWGDEDDPAFDAPAGSYESLSAGTGHFCALDGRGRVTCWGGDDNGQAEPPAEEGFESIDAGGALTCALSEGAVRCWGASIQ